MWYYILFYLSLHIILILIVSNNIVLISRDNIPNEKLGYGMTKQYTITKRGSYKFKVTCENTDCNDSDKDFIETDCVATYSPDPCEKICKYYDLDCYVTNVHIDLFLLSCVWYSIICLQLISCCLSVIVTFISQNTDKCYSHLNISNIMSEIR